MPWTRSGPPTFRDFQSLDDLFDETSVSQRKRVYRLHMKRLPAQIEIKTGLGGQRDITKARLFSTDFAPGSMRLFTTKPFEVDQEIAITIDDGERFFVRAKVKWCQNFGYNSQVVFQEPYAYRIEVHFVFTNTQEKERVRKYSDDFLKRYAEAA